MPVTTPTAELVRDNCDHRDCTAPSPHHPPQPGLHSSGMEHGGGRSRGCASSPTGEDAGSGHHWQGSLGTCQVHVPPDGSGARFSTCGAG